MKIRKLLAVVCFGLLSMTQLTAAFAVQEAAEMSEEVVQVDINTADAETLARVLDGVGIVRARDIIAYREAFGAFQTVEELLEVQGIGPATLERNRHKIILGGD